MAQSKIFIVGSLAFDIIFSIPGDFRDSIPLHNGKIRNFNATYIANDKKEFPGGTAGNISFWLGQEKVPSTIFSSWGKDFSQKNYRKKLENLKVKITGFEGDYTAHAYMVSDILHQQLIIWQPNSYQKIKNLHLEDFLPKKELKNFKFAIFSAGTPSSIKKHLKEFRKINRKALVILDPGQVSQFFKKKNFLDCCRLSNILVGNNIEFKYFEKYGIKKTTNSKLTSKTPSSASFPSKSQTPKSLTLIETLGQDGANIIQNGKITYVKAIKIKKVIETTGAGDAFRAGLLSALSQNKSLKTAVKRGVYLGAECVKIPSAQF